MLTCCRLVVLMTVVTLTPTRAGVQISPPQRAASQPLTTAQIAAAASEAVVTIVTFDNDGRRLAQGSGFVVRADGVIVTNWHVMVGASRASVSLKTGESIDRVSFLAGDESADVVLLKIPRTGLRSLTASADLPEVGSRVVALGSPLGLSGTVSEGIISAIRLVEGRQLVQITAAISPGSSGGPIIDSVGRAFAIATESLEGMGIQQLNFAVPVKYATGLISSQLAERPLAASPVGRAPVSDFAVSAREFGSWSRPVPIAVPVPDLSGQYAFVSRSTSRSSGLLKGKSLGMLVIGRDVGLWASPGDGGKGFRVLRVGPLTSGAAGTVALGFTGLLFAGYQTSEGFWVSLESAQTDEVLEIQTKRFSSERTENNGLYSVICRTKSVGSIRVAGGTYPIVEDGPEWVGEAAAVVIESEIHIDLLLKNGGGGSIQFTTSGLSKGGSFDLRDSGQRLIGTLANGRLQAQWIDQRTPDLRFEGPLLAERR